MDTAREIYEAFRRGNVSAILAKLDDTIEWETKVPTFRTRACAELTPFPCRPPLGPGSVTQGFQGTTVISVGSGTRTVPLSSKGSAVRLPGGKGSQPKGLLCGPLHLMNSPSLAETFP